ncbi:DUF3010 family protein [Catenovulum sp. SX2]|uniref:DUF3010 family protein n=1 Tax=Catenovulum sp. SX2 TaxID=3398614 RepID=UPI003F827E45
MKVCGVEIKSNEAIICLLTMDGDVFDIPNCRAQKVVLTDASSAEGLADFQFTFGKLMHDYKIEHVVIKERPMKGKFAGSALGFKLEAAIQLLENVTVEIQSPQTEKAVIKRNPMPVDFKETGLKGFQQSAFVTAYSFSMKKHFKIEE